MNQKFLSSLFYSSILFVVVLISPNYINAAGSCVCTGFTACNNVQTNGCTGGSTPLCSGPGAGFCGCSCVTSMALPTHAEQCDGGNGINTAIGCIPYGGANGEQALAAFLLKWGMGIGGGIATILIVVASFMISTSQGDPRRLQAGKELLTSAISGLVLLVFSAFILRLIGFDILGVFS